MLVILLQECVRYHLPSTYFLLSFGHLWWYLSSKPPIILIPIRVIYPVKDFSNGRVEMTISYLSMNAKLLIIWTWAALYSFQSISHTPCTLFCIQSVSTRTECRSVARILSQVYSVPVHSRICINVHLHITAANHNIALVGFCNFYAFIDFLFCAAMISRECTLIWQDVGVIWLNTTVRIVSVCLKCLCKSRFIPWPRTRPIPGILHVWMYKHNCSYCIKLLFVFYHWWTRNHQAWCKYNNVIQYNNNNVFFLPYLFRDREESPI